MVGRIGGEAPRKNKETAPCSVSSIQNEEGPKARTDRKGRMERLRREASPHKGRITLKKSEAPDSSHDPN